jgi:MYXO-CTERM domain-containing protein
VLALLAAALWPTAWWMGRRMLDGSDEPLGALALAALALLLWHCRSRLRAAPRLGWLASALALAAASTAVLGHVPPLLSSLLGLLALGAGLVAFLPPAVATAPVLGLSLLSLPLLASLQFYAGYPLRVITAEASRWLLAAGFEVERSGASLRVDGQLVMVDAPCSGVQMLWLGYFTACAVALHAGRRDAAFLARLPVVSVLVLAGNVLRNSVLVAFEGAGRQLPGWAHQGVGLAALAAVCAAIAWVMHAPRGGHHVR